MAVLVSEVISLPHGGSTGELASRVPPSLSILSPTPVCWVRRGVHGIAAAPDNTPRWAGKWQAAHQPPARPLSGGPGLRFTLAASFSLPWLPSLTGSSAEGREADVRDVMWESCAALGCGSPGGWGDRGMCQGPAPSWAKSLQGWLPPSSQRTQLRCVHAGQLCHIPPAALAAFMQS